MDLTCGFKYGDLAWSKDDTTTVKETILSLRNMDLLPREVHDILYFAGEWGNLYLKGFPSCIGSVLGIIIGQACVDSKIEVAFILEQLPLSDQIDQRTFAPEWLVHTLKEILSRQPAIIAPHVTAIIKAMVPNWVKYAQAEVDKLMGAIWRAEHVAIIEYLTRIRFAPVGYGFNCFFMDGFPNNCAILDALCRVQWPSEVIRCGSDAV